MKGELLTVTTSDELILHGMYCPPEHGPGRAAYVHVHGSYGNFYENFFLTPLADACQAVGVAFISIATRGRDYYSDFKTPRETKYESTRIGGIREIFQECDRDLRTWTDFARARGFAQVILGGHSLGAMKVVYAMKKGVAADRVILLSPPDNFGLQETEFGSRFAADLELARTLASTDRNALMPDGAYFDPISAGAYLSLLATSEDTGMFTYGDPELMRRAGLARVSCPTLVSFASEGEAIVQPVEQCIQALKNAIPASVETRVIEGANHNYHFREAELARYVSGWLSTL